MAADNTATEKGRIAPTLLEYAASDRHHSPPACSPKSATGTGCPAGQGSRYGGRLLFSLDYTDAQLRHPNPFLKAGLKTVICRPGYSRQQYQYLQNVLNKFWGDQLQPYLAMLNRQYYAIADALTSLLNLTDSPPLAEYRQSYANGRESAAINQLRQSTLDHEKIWQPLSQRCR